MGGSAFSATLKPTAFPRLPPPVYHALKASFYTKLVELYEWVGVPVEAPEKTDHGDVDFLVAVPKLPYISEVPHEIIQKAVGATFINPMDGNRTSNYAVPVAIGEWEAHGHLEYEQMMRNLTEDQNIYYQVDVHVCCDKAEWERIVFFHSYGDLGMILGVIARNAGLALGSKGLKLPDQPNPPFDLSDCFSDIIPFLGLSLDTYRAGFQTKQDVFKWVATSNVFDPTHFQSSGLGFTKVKADRKMYAEFVLWVEEQKEKDPKSSTTSRPSRDEWQLAVREKALVFFNKKKEYLAIVKARLDRVKLKESFSGSRVRDWLELGGYWKGVKMVMDAARERFGGEEGILQYLDNHGEDEFRKVLLGIKEDLGLVAAEPSTPTDDLLPKHEHEGGGGATDRDGVVLV